MRGRRKETHLDGQDEQDNEDENREWMLMDANDEGRMRLIDGEGLYGRDIRTTVNKA